MKYLYFGAPWCGPCQMMKPMLEKLPASIVLEKFNVDTDSELAEKYGVMKVPTIILTDKEGTELNRIVGSTTQGRLEQIWNEYDPARIF